MLIGRRRYAASSAEGGHARWKNCPATTVSAVAGALSTRCLYSGLTQSFERTVQMFSAIGKASSWHAGGVSQWPGANAMTVPAVGAVGALGVSFIVIPRGWWRAFACP